MGKANVRGGFWWRRQVPDLVVFSGHTGTRSDIGGSGIGDNGTGVCFKGCTG